MSRVVAHERKGDTELTVTEDDVKRSKNGDVTVRGHYTIRKDGAPHRQPDYKRRRHR